MQQRVALVTGANKGIGFAVVKALAKQFKGIIYLTSRDEKRGREAVEKLRRETGADVCYHQLDVTDPTSCIRCVEAIKKKHGGIDCLVNNAGIYIQGSSESPGHQAQQTMDVNFFAMDRFSQSIFPLLRPHARVVNVSSKLGHLDMLKGGDGQHTQAALRLRLANPDISREEMNRLAHEFLQSVKEGTEQGWTNSAYGVSKLFVAILTRIQQRELDQTRPGEDIVVNAVHPGYVDTDMTGHKGTLTADQGAEPLVYCALLPENVQAPRGGFVWNDKRIVDFFAGAVPA